MDAKENQSIFIKTYLKPALKQHGYLTGGQTWWRDQGDFYIIINLQNFSWNTKDDVTFCFNIGIGLKSLMKDHTLKPKYTDLTIPIRQDSYLPDSRKVNQNKNTTGYIINSASDINDFIKEIKIDFEEWILPALDELRTIADCINYYEKIPFWGDHLKRVINK
jgi:hypothetical protein